MTTDSLNLSSSPEIALVPAQRIFPFEFNLPVIVDEPAVIINI